VKVLRNNILNRKVLLFIGTALALQTNNNNT